ncbi:MAG: hypothetical protein JKY16_06245 [Lutibacter sp.]|nr:hypothetical protein [Lutibacter sp.]
MKQIFKKIVAISMTFVLLFSTMSFTISDYYCGGNLVDSSIFPKDDFCDTTMQMPVSMHGEDCTIEADSCCDIVVKIIEGQNELKINYSDLNFKQQQFIASFTYSYINLFEGLDTSIIPFRNYLPPIIDENITVLYQTFLI